MNLSDQQDQHQHYYNCIGQQLSGNNIFPTSFLLFSNSHIRILGTN